MSVNQIFSAHTDILIKGSKLGAFETPSLPPSEMHIQSQGLFTQKFLFRAYILVKDLELVIFLPLELERELNNKA